jgi:uncharacterized protein with FMN-binding domain
MRRAPLVLAGTVAGTAAVLGFQAHTAAPAATSPTTAAATATPSAASGSSSSGVSGTATGDAVDTRYGAAQVRVTVEHGKITKIEALQLQDSEPRSVQISSSAEPILREEALAAQSAQIDVVGGATFTSESYAESLQSALDKLGFRAVA